MAFLIGYLAIVASFGMTLMTFETWAIAFRFARHLLFAVGGFAFAWAAWRLRGHILATTGDPR